MCTLLYVGAVFSQWSGVVADLGSHPGRLKTAPTLDSWVTLGEGCGVRKVDMAWGSWVTLGEGCVVRKVDMALYR